MSILLPILTGTVMSLQKISALQGGLTEAGGLLDNADYFGGSVAAIGDLNGDGVADLAVGAYADSDGGPARGAVYVLFMNTDGTVKSSCQKLLLSVLQLYPTTQTCNDMYQHVSYFDRYGDVLSEDLQHTRRLCRVVGW